MVPVDRAVAAEVEAIVAREAFLLDTRRWADWLALYADDAIFWVPAWASDDGFTTDPDNNVSLMYMDKAGLEARVFRIESADSWATEPLPFTAHLVTSVLVTATRGAELEASAAWLVRSFARTRGATLRGGRYDYVFRRAPDGLRIARKTVYVHDDRIVGALDVYNI